MILTLALACLLSTQPKVLREPQEPVHQKMTSAEQLRTKTVILGTFPDNQQVIDTLHGIRPVPQLKERRDEGSR